MRVLRRFRCRTSVIALVGLALAMLATAARADHSPRLKRLLAEGKLAQAHRVFSRLVDAEPGDQQARTALGVVRFLQGIESLAQANYRHGILHQHARNIPLARLPVPLNESPEPISYDDMRQIVREFSKHLHDAEAALAEVDTYADVKLQLYLGQVSLDINGDGTAGEEETLWRIFQTINRGISPEQGTNFSVTLDGADVHWLRGYCHFLMAFTDFLLAYDQQELFERCGHLLYPEVESPYEYLKHDGTLDTFDAKYIADFIAFVHLINFPLEDADRMRSAHAHLLEMMNQSRQSWERAMAETDDDREWIPNPNQTGVLRIRVPEEVVTGWQRVIDEMDAILQGRKLMPFWRAYATSLFSQPEIPDKGIGINIRRFFQEPQTFDLVMIFTGSGVGPYLEEGDLSTPEAWSRLTRVFGGEFFGFAVWFN